MSDNKISPRRRNHHWPCRWDWMDWSQNNQRRPDQRPQCKCYELRQVHRRHGWQHCPEKIPGGPENTSGQYVNPCIYIRTMATLAIMIGGAVLNAATFIGGNYLAKALSGDSGQAALDEKKNDMTLPLKNIKEITRNTKRIAHSSWTGLQNKIAQKLKLSTIFKILTKHWPSTTKHTEQS